MSQLLTRTAILTAFVVIPGFALAQGTEADSIDRPAGDEIEARTVITEGQPDAGTGQTADPLRPEGLRINDQGDVDVLNTFIIGPTRSILTLNPGDEEYVDLQITNREGHRQAYKLTTEDFVSQDNASGSPSGDSQVIAFRGEIGTSVIQPTGTYQVRFVELTASTN